MTNASLPANTGVTDQSRTLRLQHGESDLIQFPDGYAYLFSLLYGECLLYQGLKRSVYSKYMLIGPQTKVLRWKFSGPASIQYTRLNPNCLAQKNRQSTRQWRNRFESLHASTYKDIYEYNQSCFCQPDAELGIRRLPPILGMDLEYKRKLLASPSLVGLEPRPKIKVSTRYLEKQYAYWIGLSPTQFVKCLKVLRASECLSEPKASIASTAKSLGYYDTSHLYKDFKSVAYISPSSYVKNHSHNLFSFKWKNSKSYCHEHSVDI